MTRPMTQQPKTEEELTRANRRANKKDDDVPEDIKNHPLTRESLKDDDTEDDDDNDNLEELREFRETVREEGNDELGVYGEPQTDDETTMTVTDENGDTQELTEDEVSKRRDVRERTWKLLDRKGGLYIKVAHWFNDGDVNKVKSGRGFHGFKADETEKALKIEVPGHQGHTAETETVWVPKKAAQTYELN